MKFKTGDRFKINNDNGDKFGTIIDTSFNSIYQEYEYIVKWDHFENEYSYPVLNCDDIWEPELIKPKIGNNCEHNWVIYNGFRDVYEYCSKCDLKKD